MWLYESPFIWQTIWVCSPCSLVLEDLNEAFWISIHLTKYLSLFPCSHVLEDLIEGFWISIHLTNYLSLLTFTLVLGIWMWLYESNSFDKVLEFVHLFTCSCWYWSCSVDFSDFEWIFLILYSIMKFLIFYSSFGSGQILSYNSMNPPNCYTLDCIDCLC